MTEGPETSYLAHYIYKYFRNKKLKNIIIKSGRYKTHGSPDNFRKFKNNLPMKLTRIYKKGKVIFLFFEKDWTIIIKLGMVGWFYKSHSKTIFKSEPNIIFEFDDENLYFTDFRNFGTVTITNNILDIVNEIDRLAPDILDNNITFEKIYERVKGLKNENKTIDTILMDQHLIMSGIGNIIKSELLYNAMISPKRKLKDLSMEDWKKIYMSSKKYSMKVYSILNKMKWNRDEYMNIRSIYQKEKDPYGNNVIMYVSSDGRKTFYVPEIQK
jgi:formamidopyrimidine-DNA glycosylase